MIYFHGLITTLCKRQGVPEHQTDETCHPQAGFDRVAIQTLMKQKGRKRKPEERKEAADVETSFETESVL